MLIVVRGCFVVGIGNGGVVIGVVSDVGVVLLLPPNLRHNLLIAIVDVNVITVIIPICNHVELVFDADIVVVVFVVVFDLDGHEFL